MAKKFDYRQYLKQTLSELVEELEISDLRKKFIKNRWLDQLMWLEGKATKEQKNHYTLRLITIVGGVIVPALVGFQKGDARLQEIAGWTAFGLSQAVAVSAALEEFFGHGEKYRNYRNTAEGLKIEGWQYLQMTGPYVQFESHSDAYAAFAERVEQYIKQDVQGFISQLESSQAEGKKKAEETTKQNAELALENLNQQLEMKAQFEEQMRQLEAERQRMEAERQQLEQERSVTIVQAQEASVIVIDDEPVNGGLGDPIPLTSNGQVAPVSTGNSTEAALADLPPLGAMAMTWQEEPETPQATAKPAQSQNGQATATKVAVPQLITPEKTADILECPLEDCKTYLPGILEALHEYDILDKQVLIGMLATVRVETAGIKPVHEWGGAKYWKRYEGRKDLGNNQAGDGVKYHGRGFIQVTGRANYRTYGQKLGVDLENNPDLAMDPKISARILACYFKERGVAQAAKAGDWRRVRKLVNGGYHGWDVFSKYVERAKARLV